MKKIQEVYKYSDTGLMWLKTAFYYTYIPTVLYLGENYLYIFLA